MASREEVMKAALEAHNEGAINDPKNSHVYLLFGDGELTMTKCGDLFGMRSLHMLNYPKFTDGTVYGFPFTYCGHKCIVLDDHDTAIRIRGMM